MLDIDRTNCYAVSRVNRRVFVQLRPRHMPSCDYHMNQLPQHVEKQLNSSSTFPRFGTEDMIDSMSLPSVQIATANALTS